MRNVTPMTEAFRGIIDQMTSGDEPPHNGGMEARLIKLEEFADDAKQRLARVETKLDHIDKEVSSFKWWAAGSAVAIILAMIAAVLGTGIAIQQMTVSTFQSASAQAQPAQQPIVIQLPQLVPTPATAPAN